MRPGYWRRWMQDSWRLGSGERSGDTAPGVAEVGDDLQLAADGSDVIGQGGKLGNGSVLDGRHALLGDAHCVGYLGLRQPCLLAHLREVLCPDLERPRVARFPHGREVIGMDELVRELLARVGEELSLLAHRCSFKYWSYRQPCGTSAGKARMVPAARARRRVHIAARVSGVGLGGCER